MALIPDGSPTKSNRGLSRRNSVLQGSKWRNLFGEVWKERYADLRFGGNTIFESNGMSCSSDFVAMPWEVGQGSVVGVIHKNHIGRNPPVTFVRGHGGPVCDLEFSPFISNLLLTACDDSKLRIFEIPETTSGVSINSESVTLTGHTGRVSLASWHPCANFLLASGGVDSCVKLWDANAMKERISVRVTDNISSLSWSFDGRLLCVTTRDRLLSVIDPRSGETEFTIEAHEGAKSLKSAWLDGFAGNEYRVVTTGFSRSAGRELALWDIRLSEVIERDEVDRGTGMLMPYWDESTGILFTAGKGDASVKFYEFEEGTPNKINEFRSSTPQKALCFIPKRCVDPMRCEIARALKAELASTMTKTSNIQPISFFLPRKVQDVFHETLYSPCFAGQPALTAEEWLEGKDVEPPRCSLAPDDVEKAGSSETVEAGKWPRRRGSIVVAAAASPTHTTKLPKGFSPGDSPSSRATTAASPMCFPHIAASPTNGYHRPQTTTFESIRPNPREEEEEEDEGPGGTRKPRHSKTAGQLEISFAPCTCSNPDEDAARGKRNVCGECGGVLRTANVWCSCRRPHGVGAACSQCHLPRPPGEKDSSGKKRRKKDKRKRHSSSDEEDSVKIKKKEKGKKKSHAGDVSNPSSADPMVASPTAARHGPHRDIHTSSSKAEDSFLNELALMKSKLEMTEQQVSRLKDQIRLSDARIIELESLTRPCTAKSTARGPQENSVLPWFCGCSR